ncbi:sensor histidine kinase [Nocardia sp. NPDC059240]|uniref:sensor histidine kinase n=1 Tax=Nocardia sp. NPDC059240 TaxID=3346786 RepID=UPI00367A6D45
MPALSLRTRVAIAAALGTAIVVGALAIFMSAAIASNNIKHLDEKLDGTADLIELNVDIAQLVMGRLGDAGAFAVTLWREDTVLASTSTPLPRLADGYRTVQLGAVGYRVKTVTLNDSRIGPHTLSVAFPVKAAESVTHEQQQRVLLLGTAAIVVASALGLIFGGAAIRPLVALTQRISRGEQLPDQSGAGGIREANQLSAAVTTMLGRIAIAQRQTTTALETARTFASTAAHELRTPLTAIRTDLEIVRGLELPPDKRIEILDDVLRKQAGVESTLTALELLASGELNEGDRRVLTDIVEIADQAVRDATQLYPDVRIRVRSNPPLEVRCSPAGIRLALDNAITNSVRHGRATRIDITADRTVNRVRIAIEDDGAGIDESERAAVFGRFYRGAGAAREGSGLGLALVAQQAELHCGKAYFTDSDLGGIRLELDIADGSASDASGVS